MNDFTFNTFPSIDLTDYSGEEYQNVETVFSGVSYGRQAKKLEPETFRFSFETYVRCNEILKKLKPTLYLLGAGGMILVGAALALTTLPISLTLTGGIASVTAIVAALSLNFFIDNDPKPPSPIDLVSGVPLHITDAEDAKTLIYLPFTVHLTSEDLDFTGKEYTEIE